MIISIDFDGTIVEDRYPEIGYLKPGAKKVIQRLHEEGHKIIINTCRVGDLERNCVNFLLEKKIPFDRINDNLPELVAKYGTNCRKISADIHIDDHNILGLPSWEEIYELIQSRHA